nr:unnamed protein product [Callosobruchus chinensis]
MSSSSSSKLKKSKERDKKRSQLNSETNSSEKRTPTKECKQSEGIGSDSINIYNEQNSDQHLSEEVCSTLSEDINYRLRYIIHDALLKARLLGRDVITHKDIEETFDNLSISKVYGATATPNWRLFDEQNLLFLDVGIFAFCYYNFYNINNEQLLYNIIDLSLQHAISLIHLQKNYFFNYYGILE